MAWSVKPHLDGPPNGVHVPPNAAAWPHESVGR